MASRSPGNDVYTVMTLIAAMMLIAAIVYVYMRNGELYKTPAWDPTSRVQMQHPDLLQIGESQAARDDLFVKI